MRKTFEKSTNGKLALRKTILSFVFRKLNGLGAKLVLSNPEKDAYYTVSFDRYKKTFKAVGHSNYLGDLFPTTDLGKLVDFLAEKEVLTLNAPASIFYYPLADISNPSPSQKSVHLADYLDEIALSDFSNYYDFVWYLQQLVGASIEAGTERVHLVLSYEDKRSYHFYYDLDKKAFVFLKLIKGLEEFTLKDLSLEDLSPADVYQIHKDSSYTKEDKLKTTVNDKLIYNYREGYAVLTDPFLHKED